jgi:hypothetical protein
MDSVNSAIAFCFILKLLRLCRLAGFQLCGRINGQKSESTWFRFGTRPFGE